MLELLLRQFAEFIPELGLSFRDQLRYLEGLLRQLRA